MHSDDEEALCDPQNDSDVACLDAASIEAAKDTNSISNNTTDTAYSSNDVSETATIDEQSQLAAPVQKTRWFILEPAVFLVFLGMYLSGAVYQNQLLYQSCTVAFGYNHTQCKPFLGVDRESDEAKEIEKIVQPYVARILMARSILESILPAFVSLFIGPWSDKFGRRPIILATFTGYLTGYLILVFLSLLSTRYPITPWIYLLSSVPSVLSGGTCALITGIYCYISDVAKEKARAARMVLNEAALSAGMMLGNVISGYIYEATNVVTVFALSSFLLSCALIYVYIFVVESLKPEQIHAGSRIREFFRFDLVKDLVRTCFQRRQSFDRAIIWLTMLSLTIAIFAMEGDSNVTYLFVRLKFLWTLKDFSLYNAARIVVQIGGSIFGIVVLRRFLNFSIVSMTMLALASCVLESTVRATAVYWWEMYVGLSLGCMRGVLGPMSRAILSHVTPAAEVGKIFAFTTSLESLSPLIAAPLYTTVYNATVSVYPGLYNFISAGLYMLCFTLISSIFGIQKYLGHTVAYQAIGS